MNSLLIHTLYALSGVIVYAALHHALIAWRRPVNRLHLLFSLMCAMLAAYVVAKAGSYEATAAEMLVRQRRWEFSFSVALFILFPWFVREYSGLRTPWLPVGLSLLMTAVLMANLLLPYGVGFTRLPELATVILPWGERIVDLRVTEHQRGPWFNVGRLGMILVFIYSLYAGWRQYRGNDRRRALMLVLAIAVFLAFFLFNQLVNHGIVDFIHTAEFGFLALVLLMNQSLSYDVREIERRTQEVLDNMPEVVYVKDLNGRYMFANRRFEELLQKDNPGIRNRTDYDLFPREQAARLQANDHRVVRDRRPLQFEEVIEVSGRARYFVTRKFPILATDGTPYAIGGTSMDVTESRRIEKELDALRDQVLHTDRVARISALSSSLAHELSQPLTAMLSNSQAGLRLLAQGAPEPDVFRDILQDIVRDDERAIAIISGLRAMLRQKKNARERVGLADVVSEALGILQDDILRRRVQCERELQPGCNVLADKVQIEQVVLNLIMNALDALDARPAGQRRLRVAVTSDGEGQARVTVRDSGTGLPPDQVERIFDSFYSTKSDGLGMGLALSRSIVEAHGGRIWANDNTDQGATVQFILPVMEEGQA
jgi:PAS domain S-box-containing protein